MEAWQKKKAALIESITARQATIEQLKTQRQALARHILLKDLPEKERVEQLCGERKHLVDTVKLIAYRAETALMRLAQEKLARAHDARALIRELLRTTADLRPDAQNKTLTVSFHPLSSHAHDEVLRHICSELNATETVFPGTDLRLIFELSGSS